MEYVYDAELIAMSKVLKAVEDLTAAQRSRVFCWANQKLSESFVVAELPATLEAAA